MKKFQRILITILSIGAVGLAFGWIMGRPLSTEEAYKAVQKNLNKFIDKNDEVHNVLLRVYSESQGYDDAFAIGNRSNGEEMSIDSRFHSASIGKTFVTVLYYILEQEGALTLEDPIIDYLSPGVLEDLFVYEGIDRSHDVTINHLLTHTSGVNDWFEGEVSRGESFKTLMLKEPDKYWTEEELIDFTRKYQGAIGRPGEQFYYSDTGYSLLILILEEATDRSIETLLHTKIFKPLEMNNTNLMFKSEPINKSQEKMLELYFEGIDISEANVLSAGNADGGIVTTMEDLLIFFKAMHNGQIISEEALEAMKVFDKKYEKGIYYGTGMMEFNLEQLSPFLKGMPKIYGGVGASGAFMMYDEINDLFIIMNVGVLGSVEESTMELIKILMIYNQIQQ